MPAKAEKRSQMSGNAALSAREWRPVGDSNPCSQRERLVS